MVKCSYCGKEAALPFKCKFCGEYFCADHRLPENHECPGLKRYKEKRKLHPKGWIYEPFRYEPKTEKKKTTKINQRLVVYAILVIIAIIIIYESLT
ncbi:MAG: hypothetical protein DRN25_02905 [Thermoplasmata archaeon]|nr:MAG: hypothetical protein DRN25_02905 [Thermoplasmata archaeon]